jgi:hypothetical protein
MEESLREPREIRSISLDGSVNGLTWDYVDSNAKKLGFKDGGSKFIQYCIEKTIHNRKFEQRHLVEILILCMVTMSFLLLLVLFMR